jgi:hypothetical protein
MSFAKKEEKKKVKVIDYHFHSDSSRNPSCDHQFIKFHLFLSSPWKSHHCEGGREEGEGA